MARVSTVVPVEGVLLGRVLDEEWAARSRRLSRPAYGRFDRAQMKTAWGRGHLQRFALTDADAVLASARQSALTATLDRHPVRLCCIDSVLAHDLHGCSGDAERLVERMVRDAAEDGSGIAILLSSMDPAWCSRAGFDRLPLVDVEVDVAQSPRHGAPMTLVRGGEDRDLPAIAAMGAIRADPFRFHLDRDVDFVRHAVATKRLLAGLGAPGARQMHFFIAEEGTTAAAYVVVSVEGRVWTIEECGDRDPSGARTGAILQGLIAREPVEQRPVIRGWLPPGFAPPQLTTLSARPSAAGVMACALRPAAARLPFDEHDVLFWHGDFT